MSAPRRKRARHSFLFESPISDPHRHSAGAAFFKTPSRKVHPLKKPLDAIEVLVINKAGPGAIAFPVMSKRLSRLTGHPRYFRIVSASSTRPRRARSKRRDTGHRGLLLIAGTIIMLVVWVSATRRCAGPPQPGSVCGSSRQGRRAAIMLTVADARLSPMLAWPRPPS